MTQELVFDTRTDAARDWAWWLYVAHAVSFLFTLGAFSFIPLILNYVKRPDTYGTFVHSHHGWQIRSFWWYLVWVVIGWVFAVTFVGIIVAIPIWVCAWLWKAYRLIRGFLALNNNEPIG